jgi:hypothetical protein
MLNIYVYDFMLRFNSGQEPQTGLGTETNRWVSCKKTPPPPRHTRGVLASHPQAKAAVLKGYEIIIDITRLAGCTPREIGEGKEWVNVVKRAETSRASFVQRWKGKPSSAYFMGFT